MVKLGTSSLSQSIQLDSKNQFSMVGIVILPINQHDPKSHFSMAGRMSHDAASNINNFYKWFLIANNGLLFSF